MSAIELRGALRSRLALLAGLLLAGLLLVPALVAATPAVTPQQALLLMGETGRSLAYEGIFTYEHGGLLRTVQVQHAVVAGQSRERLVFLNGPYREIIYLDGSSCAQGAPLRDLDIRDAADIDVIERHYQLSLKGIDRVAGREVQLLYLEPRDELRYGHVFGLDRETGMLLQSMLVGDDGRVLERFQFSDIRMDVALDESLFDTPPSEQTTVIEHHCQRERALAEAESSRWRAGWLPPGFQLTAMARDVQPGRDSMTFTDGLAVFSVFVDTERGTDLPELQAQRGATVAFLAKQAIDGADYAISVVGEVPPHTAQRVALSLSPL